MNPQPGAVIGCTKGIVKPLQSASEGWLQQRSTLRPPLPQARRRHKEARPTSCRLKLCDPDAAEEDREHQAPAGVVDSGAKHAKAFIMHWQIPLHNRRSDILEVTIATWPGGSGAPSCSPASRRPPAPPQQPGTSRICSKWRVKRFKLTCRPAGRSK